MRNTPLFKIIIPFILGILLQLQGLFPIEISIGFLILSLSGLFCIYFFQHKYAGLRKPLLYFITLSVFICCFSGLYTHFRDERLLKNYITQYLENADLLEIEISEMPIESTNSVKSQIRVLKAKDSLGWHNTSGKAIVYFEKTEQALHLQYGDKLLITNSLSATKPPRNPQEFNYQRYLANKQIHYQSYVPNTHWSCIEKGKIDGIFAFGYAVQKNLLQRLKNSGLSPSEAALSSALLLGIGSDIDASTMHAFASAGITHVLCVSGLHVGIIASIIGYALFFLNKTKQLKRWKAVIQIFTLFLFALITGFAPSVLRAVFMFSILIIGKTWRGSSGNTFNSLAASALILLVINPLLITQVGFQLSYCGVLGIITFQPILERWIHSNTQPFKGIYSLSTVTIAAQLGTLPFTLYYFHQFPLYFLVANVLILPFISILLFSVILVLFFAQLPWLGAVLVSGLSYEIKGLSFVINKIEALPYSLLNDIPFGLLQALLSAACILFFALTFLQKKPRFLMLSLSLFVLLLFNTAFEAYSSSHQEKSTLYALDKKSFAVEFTSGNTAYIVGNKTFMDNLPKYQFQMQNNQIYNRLSRKEYIALEDTSIFRSPNIFKKGHFLLFGNSKWLFYDKSMAKTAVPFTGSLDYLVLLNNPFADIEKLKEQFDFKTLVFANSNYENTVSQWQADCDRLKISYYSVPKQGAFEVLFK